MLVQLPSNNSSCFGFFVVMRLLNFGSLEILLKPFLSMLMKFSLKRFPLEARVTSLFKKEKMVCGISLYLKIYNTEQAYHKLDYLFHNMFNLSILQLSVF